MRKLLNSLYIMDENAYLSLDGENIVCLLENNEKFRVPFTNIESIFCFNYTGCSPALMGKCVEYKIPINFISPQGKFLARVVGETRGNVNVRLSQYEVFKSQALTLSRNTIATKISNTISLIKRSQHDNANLKEDKDIINTINSLNQSIINVYNAKTVEEIIGIEGYAASKYFEIFQLLLTSKSEDFVFTNRTKRPPLDRVNAVLSFLYTIYTSDYQSALETAGLDSYVGFLHKPRSGRSSLACDLVEESRHIVERMVISMINLKILNKNDFNEQVSGAVWLTSDGRKKVLTKWQEKKRTEFKHPYLGQKIQFGLIPYVQANLMSKYIRGELQEYPSFVNKQR